MLNPQLRTLQTIRMADSSGWRPKTVDPLGKAWGVPAQKQRDYALWLDLRTAENTFAQMVVIKLFYDVRRTIDEAGRSLPRGAAVEGLLFDEARYERAVCPQRSHPTESVARRSILCSLRHAQLSLSIFVSACSSPAV